MPGTFSQIRLNVIFSTKRRTPWLTEDITSRIYPYIGGIIRQEDALLLDMGGVEDHVHLYLLIKPDTKIADLVRAIKSRSTKWVRETFPKLDGFAWQEGYSVFSVSKSQEDAVRAYIAGQAEHHRKFDFKAELARLLEAHGVDFDERYLVDEADP